MTSFLKKAANWKYLVLVGALVLAGLGIAFRKVESSNAAAPSGTATQITFSSPDEAGAELATAAKAGDQSTLSQILGVDTSALLTTGDNDTDKAAMDAFASKYDKMNRWVDMTDGTRVLYVGADNFAFPVPLVKNSSGQWYSDAVAGAQEVRARDIGRNELLAMDACAALANAEDVYFEGAPSEYTQRIISTPGKKDGLYWPASDAQPSSPLARLSEFPKSPLASLSPNEPLVIDGYTLRILTAQGDDAPGGAQNYVVNGKLTRRFAVLATPVGYAETGIMTFITGSDGIVYERDFGPDTAKIAGSIEIYNPDQNWSPVE